MKIPKSKKTIENINNGDSNGANESTNREVLVILYIFLALFLALIAYLVIFTYRDSSVVINSSYNKRLNILSKHVYRGNIYASDDSVIAETIVDEDRNERREYPYGKLFAHSVGYSAYGGLGVESMYAYSMLTSSDNIFVRFSKDIRGEKNLGNNVYTTLNPEITYAAYNALGDRRGAVVVTDVRDGAILCIVSKPDFDPNTIEDYWEEYNASGEGILLNRATLGLYPPGSTFKIVTALEYIRQKNNTEDYGFDCSGTFTKDGSSINCYHMIKHNHVDFTQSFAKSCNSSFANMASMLNKKEFKQTCEELLFNEELPIPYSYKKSVVSLDKKSKMDELLQTGIGQGETLVTPMHLNLITAAIANDGVMMTPYVLKSVKAPNGNVVTESKSKEYKRILTSKEAETLTSLMEAVVLEGTATKLRDQKGYNAAGKTGSAEYSSDKSKSHAWFTGFAPVDDPEIAVTVIVEGGGSGGETAVPIAKQVMDTYFGN